MSMLALDVRNIMTATFIPKPSGAVPIIDDGKGPYRYCATCGKEHPLYVFRRYINAAGEVAYPPSCRTKYRK